MYRVLGATMMALMATAAANAADILYESPPLPQAPVDLYDWSGVYVGANAGHMWSRSRTTDNSITTSGPLVGLAAGTFTPPETFAGEDGSDNLRGWAGGIQLGANRQSESLVYGIEADYQWSGADAEDAFIATPEGPYYESRASLDHFGTLRGRIGYAADALLFYGTAGVAVGRSSAELSITGGVPGAFTGPTFSDTQKEWLFGYAIGGGVEAAVARTKWTVKAEYLYSSFGAETYDFSFEGSDGSTATTRADLDAHVLRVGLNYRF